MSVLNPPMLSAAHWPQRKLEIDAIDIKFQQLQMATCDRIDVTSQYIGLHNINPVIANSRIAWAKVKAQADGIDVTGVGTADDTCYLDQETTKRLLLKLDSFHRAFCLQHECQGPRSEVDIYGDQHHSSEEEEEVSTSRVQELPRALEALRNNRVAGSMLSSDEDRAWAGNFLEQLESFILQVSFL